MKNNVNKNTLMKNNVNRKMLMRNNDKEKVTANYLISLLPERPLSELRLRDFMQSHVSNQVVFMFS